MHRGARIEHIGRVDRCSLQKVEVFRGSERIDDIDNVEISTGDNVSVRLAFQCKEVLDNVRVRLFFESQRAGIVIEVSSATQIPGLQLRPEAATVAVELPELPLRVGAYSIGVSVHSDDTTVLMAQQIVGMLCVVPPPVTVAAKGDGGLVRVNAGWRSDIDSLDESSG